MIRKNYFIVVLSVLFLILALCSCKEAKIDEHTIKQETDQPVTKEWLMETYGITESELDGIDLNEIWQSEPWMISEMDFNNKKEVLNVLRDIQKTLNEEKELQQWLAENSLSYLLEGSVCTGVLPEAEELKWLIMESVYISNRGGDDNSPMGYNAAVIDFQNGIVYYGLYNNPMSVDYRQANEKYALNDTEKQALMQALENANVSEWEPCEKENSKWHLGIEFNDGSVYTYEIASLSGKPRELAQAAFAYSTYGENYWGHYWDE